MILKEEVLFSIIECQSIISYSDAQIVNWNMKDRKYNSQSINYSSKTSWLFSKLKNFFEQETGLKITKNKEEIHFHKFVKNNWFGKHNDIRDNRLYAIGVLLNDNFEGGNFKLYNPNEQSLNKAVGNTYLFDVKIEHEITPVLEGERFSLLWFLGRDNVKSKAKSLI
jgi:hypothetical protein